MTARNISAQHKNHLGPPSLSCSRRRGRAGGSFGTRYDRSVCKYLFGYPKPKTRPSQHKYCIPIHALNKTRSQLCTYRYQYKFTELNQARGSASMTCRHSAPRSYHCMAPDNQGHTTTDQCPPVHSNLPYKYRRHRVIRSCSPESS